MESNAPNKSTSPPANHDHHPNGLSPSSSNKFHGGGSGDDGDRHSGSHNSNHLSESEPPAISPPPNQEMERSPSAYRIPLSVFERNKSSTPADWSTASNESLFSIHMGNMSFANDDLWKSGDLAASTRLSTSDQMFSYANSFNGGAAQMRTRDLGIAEATMLEVIQENEGRSPESSASQVRKTTGSNHNMSFAFSVGGGDAERLPSSVKSSRPSAKAEEEEDPEATPAAEEKGAETQPKRLLCFPCCSFC